VCGGKKLKAWLKDSGKTQAWLAKQLGVRQTHISAYCNGVMRPSDRRAQLIEGATNGGVLRADFLTPEEIEAERRVFGAEAQAPKPSRKRRNSQRPLPP
jgi:DNA-binding transcriptional regulator YdaS (Cro superfamily)